MNKTAIKNFAVWARNKLIAEIVYKAGLLGVTDKGIAPELPASTDNLKFYDIGTKEPAKVEGSAISQRESLVSAINNKAKDLKFKDAFEYVVEEVAYTWFNRLIAIRFMEVNGYLPSGVRVLSSEYSGKNEPDMVTTPFDTDIDFSEKDKALMPTLKDDELFRFLFIKQCNKLNAVLPELFEKTENYTELLLTLSFTDTDSVVYHLVHDIPEDDFNIEKEGQVQIIGWLYQYYNSEPKDKVFAALKKNVKISKENIPAATQLFTPDWIVRYMVENSLGRLWADGHSDFDKSEWKYYLEEAEQEESVKAQLNELRAESKNLNPEEIRFIDPCMGSGHILVYAFDVLMQIYLSQGYTERDAASLIIEKNLYGADIDKRAYQLSYFALMMKGRAYDRRFLTRNVKPNLCNFQELAEIDPANLTGELGLFARQFANCDTYGSLIEVQPFDTEKLSALIEDFEENLETLGYRDILEKMLVAYRIFAQKYDVCCTNPPYMGANKMNTALSDYLKYNYPSSKSDLFAAFIECCSSLVIPVGYYSLITPQAFMFLQSYEKLRYNTIQTKLITNMAHLGYGTFGADFGTTAFIIQNYSCSKYKGTYVRLTEYRQIEEKQFQFSNLENRFIMCQQNYINIQDNPFAYWISNAGLNAFSFGTINQYAVTKQGFKTGNNDIFLRLWHEVSLAQLFLGIDKEKKKWFPCNKGGDYRKWYGNKEYVVNWENNGYEIINYRDSNGKLLSRPQNISYNFREGLTWSTLSSGKVSFRFSNSNMMFESKGSECFPNISDDIWCLLGFLNSNLAMHFFEMIAPTVDYSEGSVLKLPYKVIRIEKIDNLVQQNISLSKTDWDSFETSWDFAEHPLVRLQKGLWDATATGAAMQAYYGEHIKVSCPVELCYMLWQGECNQRFNQLKENEEELNRIFIDIYGLQDELTPEVEEKDVTVRKADLQREIKSLISYAVGCMFGRYSLDRDGLVFAGGNFDKVYWKYQGMAALDENGQPYDGGYAGMTLQGYSYRAFRNKGNDDWTLAKPLSFCPDVDNIIPITDEEYFSDDIVGRFVEFIREVYGEDSLEANLDFIAKALGNRGNTSRQIIRNYFLNDFIKDHIKTYQKRPIYWLFDSGKQNGFKALVYMHRWNADTIGKVRVDYLHKLQRVYESEITRMQETIDNSTNTREVANAEKRKDKLLKQLKETREYDEKISHLALARIDIDLDDGVKVNYEKVQTAQDGKKLEVLVPIK